VLTSGARCGLGSPKSKRLRMKLDSRTGSFKFFYDLLFDYPFGGVEVQNMRTLMDLIREEHNL
jgi:hypothetical protein